MKPRLSVSGDGGRMEPIDTPEMIALVTRAVAAMRGPDARLGVFIDPGQASAQDVAEVLISLSELNRASGGRGLKFEGEGLNFIAVERSEDDDAIEALLRSIEHPL